MMKNTRPVWKDWASKPGNVKDLHNNYADIKPEIWGITD